MKYRDHCKEEEFRNILFQIVIICSLLTAGNHVNAQDRLILGADLSYINEIEDCGGTYSLNGKTTDPFEIFSQYGANIVRVRLWHSPDWTSYSTYPDVEKTIRRAKENNMQVLLDFHYSDDWADPQKQIIPAAWAEIKDPSVLQDSIYDYTYKIIKKLNDKGILPEMIQVGNEINNEILMPSPHSPGDTINWTRNVGLLNKAIEAVHDASAGAPFVPEIMIHIAQPENALSWFEKATSNQLADFDIIGISYYSKWSVYKMEDLSLAVSQLRQTYGKEVMVAETAYPWTLQDYDEASNILGANALAENYPATPDGQYRYMTDLTKAVVRGGGCGVIYWEPAWISSPCSTRWGKGSHWENAAFFNPGQKNEPLPAMNFFSYDYLNN